MTKADIYKIMEDNSIFPSEVDDAIRFVADLLEFCAKEIEENEPYATTSIRRLKEAAWEAWSLHEYVEDVMEGRQ